MYRVPSSVAFLNCGNLIHAVLPKSACWCVDGKTKFVLGVPGKKYYRIELPCEGDADQAKADEFKVVLAKIAQYETIKCPFKRGFSVDLPESNENTPKRPWRPKHSPGMTSPWSPEGQHTVDEPRIERSFHSPARESSPSLRKPYRPLKDAFEASDNESISDAGLGGVIAAVANEPRVPQLIATFDEFGPGRMQAATSPALEVQEATGDTTTEAIKSRFQPESPSENVLVEKADLRDSNTGTESPEVSHTVERKASEDFEREQIEHPEISNIDLEENPDIASKLTPDGQLGSSSLRPESDMESLNWLEDGENDETPVATRPSSGLRSFTAPIFSSLRPEALQAFKIQNTEESPNSLETESLASVESTSSFHSLHSPTSPVQVVDTLGIIAMPPSPSSSTKSFPNLRNPKRQTPAIITNNALENTPPSDRSTPKWARFSPLSEDAADNETEADTESDSKSFATAASPPRTSSSSSSSPTPERQSRPKSPAISLRAHRLARRTQSPMPPPANIYIPPASFSSHLTNVILNKTASILLGPPVQLVALMLNLARCFADGSLKGQTYVYRNHEQSIPCEWCDSDLDVDGNSSEEDDYGISIGGTPEKLSRKKYPRSRTSRRDERWDLD